jgi:hypothetical protein
LKRRSAKFHDISEPKLELIENAIDAYAGSLADVDKNKKVDHHCRPRELVNSLLIIPARRNTIHGAGLAQICVRTAIGGRAAPKPFRNTLVKTAHDGQKRARALQFRNRSALQA